MVGTAGGTDLIALNRREFCAGSAHGLDFHAVRGVNFGGGLYRVWHAQIFAVGRAGGNRAGVRPSWSITSDVILSNAKNFLVGSGFGTFGVDFSKFRTADFNNDQFAWSLRFNQPFSSLLALLAEGGLATFLVFIFLCLFALGHALNSWFRLRLSGTVENIINELGLSQNNARLDVFLVVAAWIVLTIGLGATLYGPVLWWLWWLMLGLVVSGLAFFSQNVVRHKEWEVEDTPQYSLSFSFVLIVVMAAVIMAGVWGVQQYMAETAYAQALRATDFKVAENKLSIRWPNGRVRICITRRWPRYFCWRPLTPAVKPNRM